MTAIEDGVAELSRAIVDENRIQPEEIGWAIPVPLIDREPTRPPQQTEGPVLARPEEGAELTRFKGP